MKKPSIFAASLLLASLTAGACDDGQTAGDHGVAEVRLHLETGTESGNIFKLVGGVFEFSGPTPTSITSDGIGPFVSVDVAPGNYQILLKDRWSLSQTGGVAMIDTRGAQLVSPNPLSVRLPGGVVTDVIFRFSLAKDPLLKNESRARVGIEVEEPLCGNGRLDPGEECDRAIRYAEATCDSLCTGGFKSCTEDRQCASASCENHLCGRCSQERDGCQENCANADGTCYGTCGGANQRCKDVCEDGRNSCRNVCGNLSALCWATCGDPLTCLIVCEPPRTACMNGCEGAATSCVNDCADARPACEAACSGSSAACSQTCVAGEDQCRDTCLVCETCSSAGQCPYLGR